MKKLLLNIWNVLKYILIYLLLNFLSAILLIFLIDISKKSGNSYLKFFSKYEENIVLISGSFISYICLIIFFFMIHIKHTNICTFIKLKKPEFNNIIKSIFVAIGMSLLNISLSNYIFLHSMELTITTIKLPFQSNIGLFIIFVVLLGPIFEEIFFRGIIFNELVRNTHVILAIIVQSLIFAYYHSNLFQGIFAFFYGIIFALQFLWTESIINNILTHILCNLFATIIFPKIMTITSVSVYIYSFIGLISVSIVLYSMFKNNSNIKL